MPPLPNVPLWLLLPAVLGMAPLPEPLVLLAPAVPALEVAPAPVSPSFEGNELLS